VLPSVGHAKSERLLAVPRPPLADVDRVGVEVELGVVMFPLIF
jgi:hypothetical protein